MKEGGSEEELELARQMKNEYCKDTVGKQFKETDREKAAAILHKIGLIYRQRSFDKIALIQSAGLLNAAIIRNPFNVLRIQSDLHELCEHILKQAKANRQNADLIGKAQEVKSAFCKLRRKAMEYLKEMSSKAKYNFKVNKNFPGSESKRIQSQQAYKISAIHRINKIIAKEYKDIMIDLSQYCQDVMGKPPFEYAIAGMGSLARCEITPYSDFEHIILLSDQKDYASHLEYFRWYSVIFHTIILNVQETIVPSLNIKSLNDKDSEFGDWFFDDHTPRGISFDGMMPHACKFPLGRTQHTPDKPFKTELIKPVREMLKYLTFEEDLKNGYHLADILTNTCFVFGNQSVFDNFQNDLEKYGRNISKQDRIEEVKHQVKKDLDSFSARFRLAKLKKYDTINIKQLVYRSGTIFVLALARIYNVAGESCFDMINEMALTKLITNKAKNKMLYAIAIACEMRLRVYVQINSQCDNLVDLKHDVESTKKFLNIVGSASTINYFQIAYCLQCEVAKQLNFTKLHFYSDPRLINFTIGLAFGISTLKRSLTKDHLDISWDLSKFDFDSCIEQLESSNSNDYVTNMKDTMLHTDFIKSLADHFYSAQIYDEALEFYQQLLGDYQKKSRKPSMTKTLLGLVLTLVIACMDFNNTTTN